MTRPWFKSLGWVWRPISWQGWALTFLALAFCAQVFLAVDRRSHSVSDTLYGIFPYVVPTFLLLAFVAWRTSRT